MNSEHLENACEEIDASIFSGDILFDDGDRVALREYAERWLRAIDEHENAISEDAANKEPDPMDTAEKAFRRLRDHWFNQVLRAKPPDREWEDEASETIRDEHNDRLKAKYDKDTEAILRGEDRATAPICAAEVSITNSKESPRE